MKRRCISHWLLAVALGGLAPALLQAASEPGLIYVQTARSGITLTPAGKGETRPLARGESLTATGQMINVPTTQQLMLVFSNGSAAYMPTGGNLTLEEFTQEPVTDTSKDREYEPTRSNFRLNLTQGSLVLDGRKPVPTSTITVTTPLAQFVCHSQTLHVQVTADTVTISLFAGTADVTVPETGFKETLQAGQTAVLTRASLHDTYPFKLSTNSADEINHFYLALRTIHTIEARVDFVRSEDDKQLHVRPIVPLEFIQQMAVDDPRFR